jgi:hypothetical protein
MYDWLPEVCREIRGNLVGIYWMSIVPLTLLLICLEFFKLPESQPDAMKVIKRAALSIIMLVTFDEVANLIAMVGDGVVEAISPEPQINQVLAEVWSFVQNIEISWHQYKKTIIWMFSLISFIFAYLGAFVADAMVHFCWAILFVMSPLMFLAYIPESTAKIAKGLYASLCTVMVWKVLWSVLGIILLKLTVNAPIAEGDDYNAVLLIVINLFIGTSMLVIPITTKAFMSGDFSAYSAGLAAVPAIAAQRVVMQKLKMVGAKVGAQGMRYSQMGMNRAGRTAKNFTSSKEARENQKKQERRGKNSSEQKHNRGGVKK